jgi:hypothetical protein
VGGEGAVHLWIGMEGAMRSCGRDCNVIGMRIRHLCCIVSCPMSYTVQRQQNAVLHTVVAVIFTTAPPTRPGGESLFRGSGIAVAGVWNKMAFLPEGPERLSVACRRTQGEKIGSKRENCFVGLGGSIVINGVEICRGLPSLEMIHPLCLRLRLN